MPNVSMAWESGPPSVPDIAQKRPEFLPAPSPYVNAHTRRRSPRYLLPTNAIQESARLYGSSYCLWAISGSWRSGILDFPEQARLGSWAPEHAEHSDFGIYPRE